MRFKAGELVIRKGDVGDWFAVVASGSFSVFLADASDAAVVQRARNIAGKNRRLSSNFFDEGSRYKKASAPSSLALSEPVAVHMRGGSFGELALLYSSVRNATILCEEDGAIWVLERSALKSLQKLSEELIQLQAPATTFLMTVSVTAKLSDEQRAALGAISEELDFAPGQAVYSVSEAVDAFYLVVKGQVRLCNALGETLSQCYRGGFFGTAAIATNERRRPDKSVAVGALRVLRFPRPAFRSLIADGKLPRSLLHDLSNAYIFSLLSSVPLLQPLSMAERWALVEERAFEDVTFKAREMVVRQGEQGDAMFIVKSGQVAVTRTNETTKRRSNVNADDMGAGAFFGEVAMLDRQSLRIVSCEALEDTELLKISRAHFERILGDATDGMMRAETAKRKRQATASASEQQDDSLYHDLTMGNLLGAGSYGRVRVAITSDGKAYALKSMLKEKVLSTTQVEHVKAEKEILSSCDHPFLPFLIGTFQTSKDLFLLQELVLGGELYTLIYHRGKDLSVADARFYGASIAAALIYLHSQLIAHRDLKPENVLLDANGYIKLIDFGFAKIIEDSSRTFCGTYEYLAPELVNGEAHNQAVDWWALGVMIFEFLTKRTPFDDDGGFEVISKKILAHKIDFPWFFNWEAADAIRRLCEPNPALRLGFKAMSSMDTGKDVREHPFFSCIDFGALQRRDIPTPFVPTISSETDTSNYTVEDDEVDDPVQLLLSDGWSQQQQHGCEHNENVVGSQPFQKRPSFNADRATAGNVFSDW